MVAAAYMVKRCTLSWGSQTKSMKVFWRGEGVVDPMLVRLAEHGLFFATEELVTPFWAVNGTGVRLASKSGVRRNRKGSA